MKVIGKASNDTYLCEVTHSELEKSVNLYYGNLKKLEVGSVMDLGAGYNFASQIESCFKRMEEADRDFMRARETLLAFAKMVGQLPKEPPHEH